MIDKQVHAIYGLEGSVIASNKPKEEKPKDMVNIHTVEVPQKDEIYLLDEFMYDNFLMKVVGTYLDTGELASYVFLASEEDGSLIRPLEPQEEMVAITFRYMQMLHLPLTI